MSSSSRDDSQKTTSSRDSIFKELADINDPAASATSRNVGTTSLQEAVDAAAGEPPILAPPQPINRQIQITFDLSEVASVEGGLSQVDAQFRVKREHIQQYLEYQLLPPPATNLGPPQPMLRSGRRPTAPKRYSPPPLSKKPKKKH